VGARALQATPLKLARLSISWWALFKFWEVTSIKKNLPFKAMTFRFEKVQGVSTTSLVHPR